MDKEILLNLVYGEIKFQLSKEQSNAIEDLCSYITDEIIADLFILAGYAGTGKTSLVAAICRSWTQLGGSLELLAPTGRSAKVIGEISGLPTSTIHKLIYRRSSALPEEGGAFNFKKKVVKENTLFVVDECSLIGIENSSSFDESAPFSCIDLLSDLLHFVSSTPQSKLIFVGDPAQLPPIGQHFSPALSKKFLEERYALKVKRALLKTVFRQEKTNDILQLATILRNLLGNIQDGQKFSLQLNYKQFKDIHLINGSELIDQLESCYRRYGKDSVAIITFSNKRALTFNLGIRSQIFDFQEFIVRGERLMVARNNYTYATKKDKSDFIANGETLEVLRIKHFYELYGKTFTEVEALREDSNEEINLILLNDTLTIESPQLSLEEKTNLYNYISEDYKHIASITKRRKAICQNRFFTAIEAKYAYCSTCHKAQGGQWPCVFIDMSALAFLPRDKQMLRWLYTAVTRASEKLYLLNIPADLYQP